MKYFLLQQYLGHHWKPQVVLPLVPQRFVSPLWIIICMTFRLCRLSRFNFYGLTPCRVLLAFNYTESLNFLFTFLFISFILSMRVHIFLAGPTFPGIIKNMSLSFIFIILNPSTSLSVVSNLNAHVKTILSSKFM